jgi:ribonuclease HII
MNIRRASLTAMARSIALLRVAPELVLVDGIDCVPGVACRQQAVVDGDARMLSIAAASVMAKVVRDRIMERLDRVWPGYGFAQHKGYATPEHLEALRRLGPCPLHRFTFGTVAVQELPFDAIADSACSTVDLLTREPPIAAVSESRIPADLPAVAAEPASD